MFVGTDASVSQSSASGPLVSRTGRPPGQDRVTVVRDCPRHGPIEFHIYRNARRARYRCKRCAGEAVTRRHHKMRAILIAEAGGSCRLCGYDRCMLNLHFHHIDPATKAFGMSMARGKSLAAYRDEAKKCVLVCANCHGEIEAGLVPCPSPGREPAGGSERST